ncbi:MAG: triose-phosphate isomerase [Deltaproteobacteria bacterium]|nr:triose-phosphate isomerase [Deltaproteobacteria bacterium]
MKKLMAANWKMYKTRTEASETAAALAKALSGRIPEKREVLVIPPFTAISTVVDALAGAPGFSVGAQNFYPSAQGAFTGEICPDQLLDLGCSFALTGHSERRHILGETDEMVGRKTTFGLRAGLKIILCVGETIEERRTGKVEEILLGQLRVGTADIPTSIKAESLTIAYEPVWAIGTGEVAQPADIITAHAFVRRTILELFPEVGADIRILYGGSVKPGNCSEIVNLDNVDGVLVGGAGLEAGSLTDIVLA